MTSIDPPADQDSRSPRPRWINLVRLVLITVTVTLVLAAGAAGIPWLVVIVPRWLIRRVAIAFLWTLLALDTLAVPAVLVGGVWSFLAAARAWKRHDRTGLARAMRWVLLASSCLAGVIAMELISEIVVQWAYQIPELPTRFATAPDRPSPRPRPASPDAWNRAASTTTRSDRSAGDGLYLVVVGESSARGEPYQPWVSVGQIVGWQLERVFPGRKILVDVRADGGLSLEVAIRLLSELNRLPDAIIVFAGHNEFQSRFGWSRNVRHYVEEGPESPLALLERTRSISSTANLILATFDRYYGETPPPPRITRELIDHPTCTPKEYAFLREDFHRRLDALAAYCNQIGALPILIVPGSNDGSFEPSRSILAGSSAAPARAAFARAFQAARAAEASDPEAAIAAYRRLIAQHPEFAECHYRLGRLLAQADAWDEAQRHFIAARDGDGLPLRCPTDFRAAFPAVARSHDALLIDGPELLSRLSPHGILDDHLFHDAQHLNLVGTIALAQEILDQLRARRAFDWPESTPVPRIDLAECARHFELDAEKWAAVCQRSAAFYARTAYVRYDPAERLDLYGRYDQAARAIAACHPLPPTSPPSLASMLSILGELGARPSR
jgi:hypothetical protein